MGSRRRARLGKGIAVWVGLLCIVGCAPADPEPSGEDLGASVEAAPPTDPAPAAEAPIEASPPGGAAPVPEDPGASDESPPPTDQEEVPEGLGALLLSLPPTKSIRGAVGLAALEAVSGMNVFVAGPHRDGAFDFTSTSDFGRYNPEFLRWVVETLFGDGRSAEVLDGLARSLPLFDAYQHRLFSLGAARCGIQATPMEFERFKEEYREATEAGRAFSSYGDFAKWTDFSAGYNAEDLAFWARRDRDGTTALVLDGLRKALARFAFPTYQSLAGCLSESDRVAPLATFFVPESFVDHETWGDASALECREELLRQRYGAVWPQDAELDSVAEAPIDDRGAILEALTSAGCPEALVAGPHYAFVRTGAQARWEEVGLGFSLEFFPPDGACAPSRIVALRVDPDVAVEPLLLRTGHPTSAVGYVRATEERGGPGADTTRLAFADTPPLARVYKTHERSTFQEEAGPERTVVARTTLWAEFDDGRTTKIEERYGVGKYTYSEPAIENVVILDVNGDGEPDFLYDIDNRGRRLVITGGGEIRRVVWLVTDEYSGVGGC